MPIAETKNNTANTSEQTSEVTAEESTEKESIQDEKTEGGTEKKKEIKCRVWEVQSHIDKGLADDKFTPEHVERYLSENEKDLKRWCWVLHDKDHYSEADVEENAARNNGNATISVKDKKPAHIHLALEFKNPKTLHALAKEIEIEPEQIQKAKAKRNHFMAIASYFTHEDWKQQDKGKYLYPDSEIHHSGNFDYRKEVNKYFLDRTNNFTNMKSSNINDIINRLESGEIPNLDWIKQRYGYAFYLDNEVKFTKAHREFIKRHYEMLPRNNILIEGASGCGKSTLAEMLARSLYPNLTSDDAFYTVGEGSVRFDDYAYQPTIIWDDARYQQFTKSGTGEVLNLLEIHPKKRNYNIKFGGVILINQVNIFTSIQTYSEFLDGLSCGEERKQFYRRVPIVLTVHPKSIDVLLNSGIFEKNGDSMKYKHYCRIPLNISSANLHLDGDAKLSLFKEALKPVIEKHREFIEINKNNSKISQKIDKALLDDLGVDTIEELFNVKPIMGEDELQAIKAEDSDERYNAYVTDWKEKHPDSPSEPPSRDNWVLRGCPESESTERDDPYLEQRNQILASRLEESRIISWLDEATGFDDLLSQDDRDLSDEDSEKIIWYYDIIINLNLAYESLLSATKKTDITNAFDKCISILKYHYHKLSTEKVVLRLEETAINKGLLSDGLRLQDAINKALEESD